MRPIGFAESLPGKLVQCPRVFCLSTDDARIKIIIDYYSCVSSLSPPPTGVSLHRKSNKFLFCQMISPPYTALPRPQLNKTNWSLKGNLGEYLMDYHNINVRDSRHATACTPFLSRFSLLHDHFLLHFEEACTL